MHIEEMKNNLRFLIIPTRFVPEKYSKDLRLAYELWKEVWAAAYRIEFNIADKLYSDHFTKQSHVAVLFYQDEPIILTTLNILNLYNPLDLDDSYFKVWSELSMRRLMNEANTIMVCGNLALNFKYRRGALGISAKDLIFFILVKYLKTTHYDSMVATVRVERGMSESSVRTGAHIFERNVPYTIPGQYVDIVSWSRSLDEGVVNINIRNIATWIWLNSCSSIHTELNEGVGDVA